MSYFVTCLSFGPLLLPGISLQQPPGCCYQSHSGLWQGILPRLTELGKLGLTFFLAFGPLVLITLVLFGGLFAVRPEDHAGICFHSSIYLHLC